MHEHLFTYVRPHGMQPASCHASLLLSNLCVRASCSGKKSLRSLSEYFVSEWSGRAGSFQLVLSPDVRWYPWLHSITWGPDYSINNTTVSHDARHRDPAHALL